MYIKIKNVLLYLFKITGTIKLSRLVNNDKICILCYHGVSTSDEHGFMPSNYITFSTFKKRIDWLISQDFNFISLDQATENLKNNKVQKKSVVITIDDGFIPCFDEMVPYLLYKNIPATMYVTTYYGLKKKPIFRLAVQYIKWKLDKRVDLSSLAGKFGLFFENFIFDTNNETSLWEFINYCENDLKSADRVIVLRELQNLLNYQLPENIKRSFTIIHPDDLKAWSDKGLDIQVHTHCHDCPDLHEHFTEDLNKNISYLSPSNPNNLFHFCYPSGIWSEKDFKVLNDFNMKTATTCELGLASTTDHPLALPRIIESEAMTMLQFEAEVNGIGDYLRKLK